MRTQNDGTATTPTYEPALEGAEQGTNGEAR